MRFKDWILAEAESRLLRLIDKLKTPLAQIAQSTYAKHNWQSGNGIYHDVVDAWISYAKRIPRLRENHIYVIEHFGDGGPLSRNHVSILMADHVTREVYEIDIPH